MYLFVNRDPLARSVYAAYKAKRRCMFDDRSSDEANNYDDDDHNDNDSNDDDEEYLYNTKQQCNRASRLLRESVSLSETSPTQHIDRVGFSRFLRKNATDIFIISLHRLSVFE